MSLRDHLDDATLIAHVDAEPGTIVQTEVHAHLASCVTCRRRLEQLRRRSDALATLFALDDEQPYPLRSPDGETAPTPAMADRGARPTATAPDRSPAPSRRSRPERSPGSAPSQTTRVPWARIAAAGLVLATVAWSPARAAIAGLWARMAPDASPPAAPVSEPAAPSVARYGFEVPGDALDLSIHGAGPATITIRVDTVAQGAVVVRGGDGSEEVVLSPGAVALHIGDPKPLPARAFEVVVPEAIRPRVTHNGERQVPRWDATSATVPRQWTIEIER